MQTMPKIASRNIDVTERIQAAIDDRIARLERFFSRIHACRVSIEGPGGHHKQGRWQVRINLTVPGAAMTVARRSTASAEDAIRDAFNAADRRLEDYVREMRGDVKRTSCAATGRVVRLLHDRDGGFIESDGREIYFHRNSVLAPGFDRLKVGTKVRFTEEMGEEGPQASTVTIVGGSH